MFLDVRIVFILEGMALEGDMRRYSSVLCLKDSTT